MEENGETLVEDRNLVFLRRLVTVLTGTMIFGVLTIVVLLVIRLQAPSPPHLPEDIRLPEGVHAMSVTFGHGWIGVATDDNRLLIIDPGSGEITDEVTISRPE